MKYIKPHLIKAETSGQNVKCFFSDGTVYYLTFGEYQLALHGNYDPNEALRFRD